MKSLKEFVKLNITSILESFNTNVLKEIADQCKKENLPFNKLMRNQHVNFNSATNNDIEIIRVNRNIGKLYDDYFANSNEDNIYLFGKNTDKNAWMFMRTPEGKLYSLISWKTVKELDLPYMHGDIGDQMTKWSRQYRDTRSGYEKVDKTLDLSKNDVKELLKAVNEIYVVKFDSTEAKREERKTHKSGATALMDKWDLHIANKKKYQELSFKNMKEIGWDNYKEQILDLVSIAEEFIKDRKIKSKTVSKDVRDNINSVKHYINKYENEESMYNYDNVKYALNKLKNNFNKLQKEFE